jgi:hypothetical protein
MYQPFNAAVFRDSAQDACKVAVVVRIPARTTGFENSNELRYGDKPILLRHR